MIFINFGSFVFTKGRISRANLIKFNRESLPAHDILGITNDGQMSEFKITQNPSTKLILKISEIFL